MTNPLQPLHSDIRSSCVLAVLPFTGSYRDWSAYDHVVTPTGCHWSRKAGRNHINFAGTNLLTVPDDSSLQLTEGTLFVGGDFSTSAASLSRLVSKRDAGGTNYDFYINNTTDLGFYDGTNTRTATVNWFGAGSIAVTFSNGSKCAGYINGAFVSLFNDVSAVSVDAADLIIGNLYDGSQPQPNSTNSALVFNTVLTARQIAELNTFTSARFTPVKTWSGFDFGATVPELEDGCVAAYDFSDLQNGVLPDRSGSGNDGTVNGNVQKVSTVVGESGWFDGYVDVGATGETVNTVKLVFRPNGNEKLIDFDGGTHVIEIVAGNLTATGFSSPTIYVDSKTASADASVDKWYHAIITTTTGFTASNLDIGREGASYFSGKLQSVQMFNTVWTQQQVEQDYQEFAETPTFVSQEDTSLVSLANESSGNLSNTPWKISSGSWKVVDDAELERITGYSRAVACVSAGSLYTELNQSFGTWEVWVYSNGTTSNYVGMEKTNRLIPREDMFCVFEYSDGSTALRRYIGGSGGTIIGGLSGQPGNIWIGHRFTRRYDSLWGYWTNIQGDGWVSHGTITLDNAAFNGSKWLVADVGAGSKFFVPSIQVGVTNV